jgi:protein tyrosine/serine phosphatase
LPILALRLRSALINREAPGIISPMTGMSLSRGGNVDKTVIIRWTAGLVMAGLMLYAPYLYYRYGLEHTKRLRPIDEGRVYRSGCLTADGFREAIAKHKIKTVISFWDEDPDPILSNSRFDPRSIKESELCKSLGVDYKFIFVELMPESRLGKDPHRAIDEFLKVMDDESSYPVLIHCKAGLHRTGVMAAIYRMEYDGWTRAEAMRELRAHGFGHFIANNSNDYIQQYVMRYQPRSRGQASGVRDQEPGVWSQESELKALGIAKSYQDSDNEIEVKGVFDANGILVRGDKAIKKDSVVKKFMAIIPASISGGDVIVLQAKEALFVPLDNSDECSGGWLLKHALPAELPAWPQSRLDILRPLGDGSYFLRTKNVDFDTLIRVKNSDS